MEEEESDVHVDLEKLIPSGKESAEKKNSEE